VFIFYSLKILGVLLHHGYKNRLWQTKLYQHTERLNPQKYSRANLKTANVILKDYMRHFRSWTNTLIYKAVRQVKRIEFRIPGLLARRIIKERKYCCYIAKNTTLIAKNGRVNKRVIVIIFILVISRLSWPCVRK
jgi:hypothetical protein